MQPLYAGTFMKVRYLIFWFEESQPHTGLHFLGWPRVNKSIALTGLDLVVQRY